MYVPLHTRSWFSFLAGGSSPEHLAERAATLGMPALALTDVNGVYGAVRFQDACRAHGVKSIIGSEVTVDGAPLVLLAKNRRGYADLCRIISTARLASREHPTIPVAALADAAGDLICLTGGQTGRLYTLMDERKEHEATEWLATLRALFGDRLYVELAHYLRPQDTARAHRLSELAARMELPTVIGGDAAYATHDDYRRYDLMSCIRFGITVFESHPERPYNGESYIKPQVPLERLLPFPDAFANTLAIADACDVELLPGFITSPATVLPDGTLPADLLQRLCLESFNQYYPAENPTLRMKARAQLQKELAVINGLDLDEYFLVVREVVEEARRRNIRCSGRGSAANSIVAYLLGITGVDPVEHGLLFERFLHSGRRGTPDIDVDFDSERREEIIAWMQERFGTAHTAMTATVITYGLRMALRDVAKALGWPLETVDRLTQAVPSHRPGAVWNYRTELAEVVGDSALFETLLTYVAALEGCPRHLGQHSGGMLLSRTPLHHYTPVEYSANGVIRAQFDKDDVEKLGLIKFDVLGLRMLAAVAEAVELVERTTGKVIPIDTLPLDDEEVFTLIRSGRNLGLFQIESQGQIHLVAQLQPETFLDLVAEVAIFRPGPVQAGMVHPFLRRRRGEEPVRYLHPDLEPVLKDTYGVILFQEQVLEIAHTFAGMSLADADRFRSLMSKFRERAQMEAMRNQFVQGAMGRGVDEATANTVFDLVSHFVGYGFCKSHAAAFAKTVYQSAWLKRYYPAAYMAAVMQHRPGMYSLMTLEEEARRFGVQVLLPDINRSGIRYDLERLHGGTLAIRKPLAAVRDVSAEDARAIVWERFAGAFVSVEDLYRRVKLSRDALEGLARSGALDELAGSSRRALWEVGVIANRLGEPGRNHPITLFQMPALEPEDIPDLPDLTETERTQWDYHGHGAARRHPMTLLRRVLRTLEIRPVETCRRFRSSPLRPASSPHPVLTVAGVVILRQMPPTANGVMFITLEDETGYIQCVVYPSVREHVGRILTHSAVIVRGQIQILGEWRGIVVRDVWSLDGMMGGYRGYASAYGGTDRFVTEYGNDQEYDGVRQFMAANRMIDAAAIQEEARQEQPEQERKPAGTVVAASGRSRHRR